MATMTRRSAKRGAKAQKMFESVKGFANAVSLEMKANGLNSEYLADIYIGYLADTLKLQRAEGEDIKSLDKRADDMATAKFNALLSTKEGREELEQSEVFKTLSDSDKIYKVFRATLPCYTEGGAFNFAKKKCIAFVAEQFTKAEAAEFEAKETWHKIAVTNEEGREVVYFAPLAYSPEDLAEGLKATRKQRRAFLKKEEETAKYWRDAEGDIFGLVSLDKANYKDLARAVSGSLQEAAAAIIRRHAEEAEAAANLEKAEKAAAAFLESAAPEKLAKLAETAAAVAKMKEEGKYNTKAKKSVQKNTNGLLKFMKDNGEAAAAFFAKRAAEFSAKFEAEGAAADLTRRSYAETKEAEARRHAAAAESLAALILAEETTAAALKEAAAPYLAKEGEKAAA